MINIQFVKQKITYINNLKYFTYIQIPKPIWVL